MLRFSLFLCLFFVGIQSRCPTVQTISQFDVTKYMGRWYELERYPFIFETFQKCVTADYALNTDGTVNVTNTGYTKIGEYALTAHGVARAADPQNPSNLTVNFGTFGSSGGPYWVLDTDYDNYSLVYSCSEMPFLPITNEYAWILARNKNISALSTTTIQNLKQILTSLGSSTDKFSQTPQDCNN